MTNSQKWMTRQLRTGWLLLAAGLVLVVVGLLLPRLLVNPGFNTRIITGLGILLTGVGAAYLSRYGIGRRNPEMAGRMAVEARDERVRANRSRAAGRAYWVSAALTYAGLMWVSFAANGSLPELSSDNLWFFLAAAFLIPFGVYIASMVHSEQND